MSYQSIKINMIDQQFMNTENKGNIHCHIKQIPTPENPFDGELVGTDTVDGSQKNIHYQFCISNANYDPNQFKGIMQMVDRQISGMISYENLGDGWTVDCDLYNGTFNLFDEDFFPIFPQRLAMLSYFESLGFNRR